MYAALLHKLKVASEQQKTLDEMQLSAHEMTYLALNAPRSIGLGGIKMFREATNIAEGEKLNCNPALVPDGAGQDGASGLDKKYNTLLEAQHYALHARDWRTANIIAEHLSGYWEAYTSAKLLPTLDQKCFEYLCEHHPGKEKYKAKILEIIEQNPEGFLDEIAKTEDSGLYAVTYLVKLYGDKMLDILKQPAVSAKLITWNGLQPETVKQYPLELLRTHLQSGDLAYFENHVLTSAARHGDMPVLQMFSQTVRKTGMASEYSRLINEMTEWAKISGQLKAYQLLKSITPEKSAPIENDGSWVMDFISQPEKREEMVAELNQRSQENQSGNGDWGKQMQHVQRRIKLAAEVLKCGAPDAVKDMVRLMPEDVNYALPRVIFDEEPGAMPPRKVRVLMDALDRPDQFYPIVTQLKHNSDNFHKDVPVTALLYMWSKLQEKDRQDLLPRMPEGMREHLKADSSGKSLKNKIALSRKDNYQSHEPHRQWELYFDCADFIQELPQSVLTQSPYGFKIDVYQKLLPLMQMAVRIEGTGDPAEMAYKLTVLFQNERKAEAYLKQFADRENPQAVHDLLLFDLPRSGEWDIETWQQLVMRDGYGPKITRILGLASKIEETYCSEHPGKRSKQLHGLRNLSVEQIYEYARKHGYERSNEHPELANLCIGLGVDESGFNQSLEVLQRPAATRNTPDINIDGENLGLKGFRLRTASPGDPVNLWIGKLVKCCNHIGGHTHANAVEQCTSPDAALYIIEKKVDNEWKPVAKVTGWIGQNGDKLVFNSWERLGTIYDRLCEPFLLAAGIEAIKQKPELHEVRLGRNRGGANFSPVPDREPPRNGNLLWYDAGQEMEGIIAAGQHEVVTREKLKLAETKLEQLTKRSKRQDQAVISPTQSRAEQVQVPRYEPPGYTIAG